MSGVWLALDARVQRRPADVGARPALFRLGVPAEASALELLLSSGDVFCVHDTLRQQLEELIETRSPERKLSADELASRIEAHAGADISGHGTWVFYPWSGQLVHVLPEVEYEELRTSRNRNKITREEQTRLAALRVGVVGLSVGQSTAVTLALEGIGGLFRLADFDTLSLSNMNRLRASVHDIGLNKAVLAARQIFEVNPYARVEVFDQGVRADAMDRFFSDEAPLDLLFEECDDLSMKFRLRREARRRGIPVLMETSDRGLIDVERFDLEPSRPLFHARVGEVGPEQLTTMTAQEKIPLVLGIIGATTMSRRLAASLIDVGATIKTWPQLASDVALGGAINTDVARRIALGQFTASGRFYVDVDAMVSGEAPPVAPLSEDVDLAAPPAAARPAAPPLILGPSEPIDGATLERLVSLAAMAPSGGNCQPWHFTYGQGALRCWHVADRSRSLLDFEDRASFVALGAAVENVRLGAAGLGVGVSLRPLPDPIDPRLVCVATFGGPAEALESDLASLGRYIELRATHRRIEASAPLSPPQERALQQIAAGAGAELRLITDRARIASLGQVLGRGDRLRLLSKTMHAEMMREIRWSKQRALATRDGLDLDTLELGGADKAVLRLLSDWSVVSVLRELGGGQGLASPARDHLRGASAVGLLTVPSQAKDARSTREAYFRGGVAMQRVWLKATELGLGLHPMTALLYLVARAQANGEGLDDAERAELTELSTLYRRIFDIDRRCTEVMLFRLFRSSVPPVRSLRRSVREILTVEG